MANTATTFDAMLKQYAPNELLRNEITKRDWFLTNIERDESWLGGELLVPFKGASASTIKAGGLTAAAEIGQSKYVKGKISAQPEVWGSLIFNEKDLMRHGKVNEQNFLKLLPGEIEDFTQFMQMALSMSFTNGPVYATAVAGGTLAGGIVKVDRIERFEIGQKFMVKDSNTAASAAFVSAIDVNLDLVTFSDTYAHALAGTDFINFTAAGYVVAETIQFFIDGMDDAANQLTNLRSSLLSSANGGSATLYGESKIAYPYLQAVNVSGSGINTTTILDQLFAAQTRVRSIGKGNPDTIVCSYKHLGTMLALLEKLKGAYRQADGMKASLYGWTEIEIVGVKGKLKIVAIQEMNDDTIFILDKSAIKVYSNGFIKKRLDPDTGKEFFTIRNTTGYQYIVDICFFGDMVLERPARCGIIYGISY